VAKGANFEKPLEVHEYSPFKNARGLETRFSHIHVFLRGKIKGIYLSGHREASEVLHVIDPSYVRLLLPTFPVKYNRI
jgi:hypothetical protein